MAMAANGVPPRHSNKRQRTNSNASNGSSALTANYDSSLKGESKAVAAVNTSSFDDINDGIDYHEPYAEFGIYFHALGSANAFEILQRNCSEHPTRTALIWNNDDGVEQEQVTYAQLMDRIRNVAAMLTNKGLKAGDRAILIYPPGLHFFYAFWACLAVSVVPVPVCPADPSHPKNDAGNKLAAIIKDSGAQILLTNTEYIKAIQASSLISSAELADTILNLDEHGSKWWTTDTAPVVAAKDFKFMTPLPQDNALAFIQYTSGSTGDPKGVMVSHGNLITNSALIIQMFAEIGEQRHNLYTFLEIVIVSWLPTFHDMGLIGFHVGPMLIGSTVSSMSPLAFIHNPVQWLRIVGRYKRCITGAPPFALELVSRKTTPQDLRQLDLTKLEALLIGAEPIRDAALQLFTNTFAPCGFNEQVLMPCYGLAEHVLFAAGKRDMSRAPYRLYADVQQLTLNGKLVEMNSSNISTSSNGSNKNNGGRWLVSSGEHIRNDVVADAGRLIIVNPVTHVEVADGHLGEIWLAGKSKTLGYWNKPDINSTMHQAELKGVTNRDTERWAGMYKQWLRTGDMGTWYNGQLYVTGRLKEMIIINGCNLYPHDIEEAVKSVHTAIRPGSVSAFAVSNSDDDDTERLTMLVELRSANEPTTKSAPPSTSSFGARLALNVLSFVGATKTGRRCGSRLMAAAARCRTRKSHGGDSGRDGKGIGYSDKQLDDITSSIRKAVLSTFGIPIADLVLLQPRTLKKTSSGKNCRSANRDALLTGQLQDLIIKRSRAASRRAPISHSAPAPISTSLSSTPSTTSTVNTNSEVKRSSSTSPSSTVSPTSRVPDLSTIKKTVISLAKRELDVDVGDIDEKKALDEYGLDSLSASKLTKLLSDEFKVSLTVFMFLADPTIEGVAKKIQEVMNRAESNGTLTPLRNEAKQDGAGNANIPTSISAPEWQPVPSDAVACVLGIGTAVPARCGTQDEAHRVLVEKLNMDDKQSKLLRKIVDGTKISRRYMVFEGSDDVFFGRKGKGNDEGIEARNEIYKKHAVTLAINSSKRAIEDWGGDKNTITHVIGVSCTGVLIPGIEFHVMTGLGLNIACERLSIQFMGCFGALSAMKAAKAIARENRRNRVLMVCVELCSLHMQLDDRVENLVASSLFADGSGAMVIGCGPSSKEHVIYEYHHSLSAIIPNTLPMMSWELSKTGMIIGLDKHIPSEIFTHISSFSNRIVPKDVLPTQCSWAIHPGGPMVLRAIMDALKLNDDHTTSSWEVLKQYGNMSSGTLVFVLDHMRKLSKSAVPKGQWIPSLAFGPGLNIEGAVLRRGSTVGAPRPVSTR